VLQIIEDQAFLAGIVEGSITNVVALVASGLCYLGGSVVIRFSAVDEPLFTKHSCSHRDGLLFLNPVQQHHRVQG
jgi:hypothetical protein